MDTVATARSPLRDQRSDALTNHEILVRAAIAAVHREGPRVPLATIASDAEVGIATLYRHFATREQLLTELTHRSFEQVLSNALTAERDAPTGLEAIRIFIQAAIDQRDDLVLPLHGGPPVTAPNTLTIRTKVHRAVGRMIKRGRDDATIAQDITPIEIITFGAMLAQPRQSDPQWTKTSGRLLATFLNGLNAPRR